MYYVRRETSFWVVGQSSPSDSQSNIDLCSAWLSLSGWEWTIVEDTTHLRHKTQVIQAESYMKSFPAV